MTVNRHYMRLDTLSDWQQSLSIDISTRLETGAAFDLFQISHRESELRIG